MRQTERAIEAVRSTLHEQCKDMVPADYKSVLEELLTDFESSLEALISESGEKA